MKTKLFLIILLFCLNRLSAFSQPSFQWDSRFSGPVSSGSDVGYAVAVDGNCNSYVTGYSNGNFTNADYFTIKYNENGDTVWTARYNGSGNAADYAYAIKVDGAGNVYLTGKSQGSGTGYDIVTIKYNSSGTQQWAAIFNGGANANDVGDNLIVDGTGNVYVVGASYYSLGATNYDAVVIKYNSSGTQQWIKNYDFLGTDDVANLISINNSGNIIVPIWSAKQQFTTSGNWYDIVELNPANGNTVFTYNNVFGFGDQVTGFPNAMEVDGNGNIYLTSTWPYPYPTAGPTYVNTVRFNHSVANRIWKFYWSTTGAWMARGEDQKIDANGNVYVLTANWRNYQGSADYWDYLTYKINSSGTVQWMAEYDSTVTRSKYPASLAINNLNNPDVYVSGSTLSANGNYDITTIKYDNNGNQVWLTSYDCGGSGDDVVYAMAMDSYENIYITGYSNCTGTSEDIKTIKYATSPPTVTATGSITICPGDSSILNASGTLTYHWSPATGLNDPNIANPVAMPATTTTYTVTGTNAFCASDTATVTVTVNPLSTIPIITGNSAICPSDSTTLSISNPCSGCTFQWSNGMTGQHITVDSLTTYTVTSANSCDTSSNSNSLTVSLNTLSVAADSMSANPNPLMLGSSTTLSVWGGTLGTGASWHWYSGSCGGVPEGTGNSIQKSPTSLITYYVRAEGTCNVTDCDSVTVGVLTGIANIESANTFNIYPNPTKENFIIELNREIKCFSVTIYNVLGKTVFTKEINNSQSRLIEINLHELPGIYFVRASDGERQYSEKVIIQ